MAYQTVRNPTQRFAVLSCVFALHVLVLAVIILSGAPSRDDLPTTKAGTLSVVSLNAEPAATKPPPPPTLPSEVAETYLPLNDALPAVETDPTSTAAASGGCKTFEAISAALLSDPVAVAAVRASPPETRSIADAIVLWNSGWIAAAPPKQGPLSAVRLRVQESLRSLERACLDEEVAGPRLIPFPSGDRTTFIVVGSGKWLWRDLLIEPEPGVPPTPTPPASPANP